MPSQDNREYTHFTVDTIEASQQSSFLLHGGDLSEAIVHE